jgi:oligosaccharide repeat unit polymerase
MGLGIVDLYAFLVLLFAWGLFRFCGGLLNFFNPASLFLLFHILLFGLGSWYRGLYAGRVWVSDEVVFIVYSSLLLYVLGAFFIAALLYSSAPSFDIYRVMQRARGFGLNRFGRFLVVVVPVSVSLIYACHVGGLIWLQSGIDDFRIEARKGVGWLALLGIASAFVGVLFYVFSHRTIGWLKGMLVIALLAACAMSYGNRAPGAEVFIVGAFGLFIVKYGRLSVLRLAAVGGVAFLVVVAAGLYRQGFDLSLYGILLQGLWRPFVNFQNFQIIYDAFPSVIPFQMGEGYLIDLSVLMPGYQPNYSAWLKDVLRMEFTGGGINQTYLGEFYSNFSLVPALCFSFLLGSILQLLYCLMGLMRCTPQLMLIVAFSLKAMVSSGLISPLLYSLIPFLLMYLIYRFLLGGE